MRNDDTPSDIQTCPGPGNDILFEPLLDLPAEPIGGGWMLERAFGGHSNRFKIHCPSQLDLAFKIGMAS